MTCLTRQKTGESSKKLPAFRILPLMLLGELTARPYANGLHEFFGLPRLPAARPWGVRGVTRASVPWEAPTAVGLEMRKGILMRFAGI